MAQIEIPESWRKQVCAILATEATGSLIQWTNDAIKRYEADSGFSWTYEAYQAFRNFLLGAHAHGCNVVMDKPVGETYEFYFPFKAVIFYGKILLRNDRRR